jgi:hypothetical protein
MSEVGQIPPVGSNVSEAVWEAAGGGPPVNYNWGPNLTELAADHLRLVLLTESLLLSTLLDGHKRLQASGDWSSLYPPALVSTIGSMAAQALVRRRTATDALQHFNMPVPHACAPRLPRSPDDFLQQVSTLLQLGIGILLDTLSVTAASDPWLIPALAAALGAASRSAGVVDMMAARRPAAAPREALLPAALAYNYVTDHYVASCPDSGELDEAFGSEPPPLKVKSVARGQGGGRATGVTVDLEGATGELYLAWLGAWGGLEFTRVGSDGAADVPHSVTGHVWAALVNRQGVKSQELGKALVAGPELVWVDGSSF